MRFGHPVRWTVDRQRFLGALALAAITTTGCIPPPSEPATTEPTNVPSGSRLYLSMLETGSEPAIGRLLNEPSDDSSVVHLEVTSDDFVEVGAWEHVVATGGPDLLATAALELGAVDGAALRWRVSRIDSCNSVGASSSFAEVVEPAGTHLGAVRVPGEWMSGDTLRLSLEARRVDAIVGQPASIELDVTKSSLEIDLVTLDGGGRLEPQPLPVGVALAPSIPGGGELTNSDVRGLVGGDFRWNNQRSMWWNSRVERWDAILPTASPPASEASAWWLWTDLVEAATPEIELSTRPSTPDVFWDDSSCELSVFFSRDATGTSRFHRFVYDPHEDRYVDSGDTDGVPVDLRGSRRVTIVRSPNGYLWAGVNHELAVRITRSTDGGLTWADPVVIRETIARGDNHWTVFTEQGAVRVGLAIGEDGGDVLFLHLDQDDERWADPTAWTDESDLVPGHEGTERVDDELSAVAIDGDVFIVVETELGSTSRSDGVGLPQLVLYRRSSQLWSRHVLTRYGPDWREDLKRPTIGLDVGRGVYVGASRADRTQAILMVGESTNLDEWQPLSVFAVEDRRVQSLYNMRVPRHPMTAQSGFPALVVEQASGKIWREFLVPVTETAP